MVLDERETIPLLVRNAPNQALNQEAQLLHNEDALIMSNEKTQPQSAQRDESTPLNDIRKSPVEKLTASEELFVQLIENSKFPNDFDAEETDHEGLKAFTQLTQEIHVSILNRNVKELLEKIDQFKALYPRVRHIYGVIYYGIRPTKDSLQRRMQTPTITNSTKNELKKELWFMWTNIKIFNKSAARVALENGCLDAYQLLVDNNITLAPDEDIEELVSSLSCDSEPFREHLESGESKPYNDTVAGLFRRTYVTSSSPVSTLNERFQLARDAFNRISNISDISQVLSFLTKLGGFQIFFDFEIICAVEIDPDDRSSEGSKDSIYIAARNLLSDNINDRKQVYREIIVKLTNYARVLLDRPEMQAKITELFDAPQFKFNMKMKCQAILNKLDELIDSIDQIPTDNRKPFDWTKAKFLFDKSTQDILKLFEYRNELDHNWLMIAAANGWSELIDELIEMGFDANSENSQTSAVKMAYDNGHYDVVLKLLMNNSKIPQNFNAESTGHTGLIEFANTTHKVHDKIKNGRELTEAEIKYIKDRYPKVKILYSLEGNQSAAYVALINNQIGLYAALVTDFLLLAPEEYNHAKALLSNAIKANQPIKPLSEANLFVDIFAVSLSCIESQDGDHRDLLNRVRHAFRHLYACEISRPVLEYLLTVGGFRVVFDFDRDSIESDLSESEVTQYNRCMLIGANDLQRSKLEYHRPVYGLLFKQLCQYALEVLYKNEGRPYPKACESAVMREYQDSKRQCEENQHKKNIIFSAFNAKSSDDVDKELLSALMQLHVQYADDGSGDEDSKMNRDNLANFNLMSDFYHGRVLIDTTNETGLRNEEPLLFARAAREIDARAPDRARNTWKDWIKEHKLKIFLFSLALITVISLVIKFYPQDSTKVTGSPIEHKCGRVKAKRPGGAIAAKTATFSYHGQWPWHAPVLDRIESNASTREDYMCGSTLITPRHLLSAAHCYDGIDTSTFFVLLGCLKLSDSNEPHCQRRNISRVFIHEKYDYDRDSFRSTDDIAVLEMAQSVKFTDFIQPICFPPPGTNVVGINGFIAGHGRLGQGARNISDIQRYAEQSTISNLKCLLTHKSYSDIVSLKSFCAKHTNAVACGGDSGGGFYTINHNDNCYMIVGVISQSLNADVCSYDDYVAYVNDVEYREWIIEKVSNCTDGKDCVSPCVLNPCGQNERCEAESDNKYACVKADD